MHDEKLQYMLDQYIRPGLFSKEQKSYCLEEPSAEERKAAKEKAEKKKVKEKVVKEKIAEERAAEEKKANEKMGATKLIVSIAEENLCIQNCDKKNVNSIFFKDAKKCVDHVIWQHKGNDWILHLIEMKTTMGANTWIRVRRQNKGTYLAMVALAAALGIHFIAVKSYTTYGEVVSDPEESPNLLTRKRTLGKWAQNILKEWKTGKVKLFIAKGEERDYYKDIEHTGIPLSRDTKGIMIGSLDIK